MIARLFVWLPFYLTVPEGEEFKIYGCEDRGYKVQYYPPLCSDRAPPITEEDHRTVDGISAFQADVLRIDFYKDTFDRRSGSPVDPPELIISQAINFFLTRLRYVTRAAQVRSLDFPKINWRLEYLNDDETELEKEEGLVKGHGAIEFPLSYIALNKNVWDDLHSLPHDYEPRPWDSLLLDARAELPRIGPAVVLAATALEVFISWVLDKLAVIKDAPPELWGWINQRGGWRQEPTVEEQYDVLLKFFTGHSLNGVDTKRQWQSFMELKNARNSFVHKGVAEIGKIPINTETAQKLIASADEVIATIKAWLPEELHWPEFKHDIHVEIVKKLV